MPSLSVLVRFSSPSETSSLLETSVVLDLDFLNAVHPDTLEALAEFIILQLLTKCLIYILSTRYMNYLSSKNRIELLLIILVIPVLGSLTSYFLGFDKIHWSTVAHLIAILWQFESILKLNRVLRGEFSITLTKISFVIWIPFFATSIYKMEPETLLNFVTGKYSTVLVIAGMAVNLIYFYMIYILTRMFSRATTGRDLSGIELFPSYLYFLIYPIGIWKYQNQLQKLEN